MKYVILRDDDANALTPPDMLEELYRPFLDKGMVVNLATIPEVRTDIVAPDGELEGFLVGPGAGKPGSLPIEENTQFIDYVKHEPRYRVLQHGLRHEFVGGHYEFERSDAADLEKRLERGTERMRDAGFEPPSTFVAPQDKLSREAMALVLERFPILSTGWYDLAKVPRVHWPAYLWSKKVKKARHWRTQRNALFTHPGCILSYRRDPSTILPALRSQILSGDITVVVSHHWEYFRGGTRNAPFIAVLHELAEWLASEKDIRVVTFDEAAELIDE